MDTLPTLIAGIGIACMAIIGCNEPRENSQTNACINNLRQIEAGKEQWALEEGKAKGDRSVSSEVNSYIKGGPPSCPAQGSYNYKEVGTDATCSLSAVGHALP